MSKAYARKKKHGSGWEVVGGGNTVNTMGRYGAEDIADNCSKVQGLQRT
jgi:hypothetical protein